MDVNSLVSASSSQAMAVKDIAWKVLIDVVCVLTVGIPILVFKLAVTPYRRGFFCDDDSIHLSYKDSTIPSVALYFIFSGLPLIAFLIAEAVQYKRGLTPDTSNLVFMGACRVHPLVLAYYRIIFYFAFGACCSQLLTDIGKYSVGRLRPHFLDICKPDVVCPDNDNHLYIVDYTCAGNPSYVKDARLSFPSGHSSFSAYCMVFLVLYIQYRMRWRGSPFLKPFIQFILIVLSLYTGLSRISDHKHNWSDVLAGFILGGVVAVIAFYVVSDVSAKRPAEIDASTMPLQSRASNIRPNHEDV